MEESASVDLDVPTALSTHNTALDDRTAVFSFCFVFCKVMQSHTREQRAV